MGTMNKKGLNVYTNINKHQETLIIKFLSGVVFIELSPFSQTAPCPESRG